MFSSDETIFFHYPDQQFFFPNRNKLKSFLKDIIYKEGYNLDSINYIFCSDEYLLRFNQQYLHHNTLTDIITFQLNSFHEPILSDIYISIERVKENANRYKTTFRFELHKVIFHGILHLCGYDDRSINDIALIRSKEEFYLHKYLVSRETI